MSSPSNAEVLEKIFERLESDLDLNVLVDGRIYNHPPQDASLPLLRFRWEQAGEWDTKDSAGYDGFFVIDIWTDHRGDKKSLEIADKVDALLHLAPLTLTSGQSLLLRHDYVDAFTEPDGLTHHTVCRFRHIVTT